MSNILALDTSTENCSAALSINGEILVREFESPREHTKRILPMVDSLLSEAGIKLTDLDALAFGRGPGSFTGVRIGTGIAQGLAFGSDLPMLPISTLAAMAQGAHRLHNATDVLPAIDARMGEIYFAQYKLNESGVMTLVGNEMVITADELVANFNQSEQAFYTLGTGWATYAEQLAALNVANLTACEGIQFPTSHDMLAIAAADFANGKAVTVEEAMPVYVRDTVTWKKLPGRG
ncbi:MAG: tRNA threonylcarbamoyladenosine biosynthesis protein TsaB [Moritella dasanensis]|jgi:tRNA threonylcarbamoyladenosine biosynthesis protein TsaB